MTENAKKSGNEPVNPEMHFRQNMEASTFCPFEVNTYSGLTKREYFAAMAMAGTLASKGFKQLWGHSISEMAIDAVSFSDALLEELSK